MDIKKKDWRTTHGMSKTGEFRSWCSMRDRCSNPKAAGYKYYGEKGVAVCARWASFENFYADMGPRPSAEHSLDRYPNGSGNYEPGNCRWATRREQTLNRSVVRMTTIGGKTQCIADWCRELGLNKKTVSTRIHYGWSVEKALLTPIDVTRRHKTARSL